MPLWARGQRRATTSVVRQDVARGEMNAVGTEMQKMSAKRGCVPRPLHVPVRARPDGVARRLALHDRWGGWRRIRASAISLASFYVDVAGATRWRVARRMARGPTSQFLTVNSSLRG